MSFSRLCARDTFIWFTTVSVFSFLILGTRWCNPPALLLACFFVTFIPTLPLLHTALLLCLAFHIRLVQRARIIHAIPRLPLLCDRRWGAKYELRICIEKKKETNYFACNIPNTYISLVLLPHVLVLQSTNDEKRKKEGRNVVGRGHDSCSYSSLAEEAGVWRFIPLVFERIR